jgi:hypothetical protein
MAKRRFSRKPCKENIKRRTTAAGGSPRAAGTDCFGAPGRPWENGLNESFNGKLCAGLLNEEILCTLNEAKVQTKQ